MKKLLVVSMALIAAASLHAQSFQKGNNVLGIGVGLGSSLSGLGSQTPAISANFEHGIWEIGGPGVISLGAYVGFKSFKYTGEDILEKWGYTIIGVRGAYHYNGIKSDKFDLYGGLMLSYNILKYSVKDNDGNIIAGTGNYGSGAGITAFIGGRYFFTPNIGAFAELGYGVSYLTLGLAFKF